MLQEQALLIARAAVADGLAAANVGRRDLASGVAFLNGLGSDPGIPWISSNLRDEAGNYPFPRWRILNWGGVSVAVFGLLPADPTGDRRLNLRVDPPAEALRDALAQAPSANAVICLSNLGLEAEKELIRQIGAVALIVGGGSSQLLPVPHVAGDTVVLHASDRGRYLGVLDLTAKSLRAWKSPRDLGQIPVLQAQLAALRQRRAKAGEPAGLEAEIGTVERALSNLEGSASSFANRVLALDGRGGESQEVQGWVRDFKARAAALRGQRAPAVSAPARNAGNTGRYAGSASCRSCHPGEYQAWLATPHARAYADLGAQGRDPRCLECHASRLERGTGITVEPVISCEVCHGPGERHRGVGNITRAPTEDQCRRCHHGFHPGKSLDIGSAYGSIRCDRGALRSD